MAIFDLPAFSQLCAAVEGAQKAKEEMEEMEETKEGRTDRDLWLCVHLCLWRRICMGVREQLALLQLKQPRHCKSKSKSCCRSVRSE
ncbi:hypothetical protein ACLKA6_001483 [Drosophila palustris]